MRAICFLQFHNAFPNFRKTTEPEFLFEYTLTLFSTDHIRSCQLHAFLRPTLSKNWINRQIKRIKLRSLYQRGFAHLYDAQTDWRITKKKRVWYKYASAKQLQLSELSTKQSCDIEAGRPTVENTRTDKTGADQPTSTMTSVHKAKETTRKPKLRALTNATLQATVFALATTSYIPEIRFSLPLRIERTLWPLQNNILKTIPRATSCR